VGRSIPVGMPALAAALCNVLGLDLQRVRSIELSIRVDEPVIATVELYALDGDGKPLTEAVTSETYTIDRID